MRTKYIAYYKENMIFTQLAQPLNRDGYPTGLGKLVKSMTGKKLLEMASALS